MSQNLQKRKFRLSVKMAEFELLKATTRNYALTGCISELS